MSGRKKQIKSRIFRIVILVLALAAVSAAATCYMKGQSEKNEEEKLEKEIARIRQIYTETYQTGVKQRLEEKKKKEDYTEENMLIEKNPYGTNNLSLYVYFRTEKSAQVTYSVSVPDEDISDFSAMPDSENTAGTEHEFEVIGLVPGKENKIVFTVAYDDGSEKTVEYTEKVNAEGTEETRLASGDPGENAAAQISDGLYVILGNDSDELDYMYYYDDEGVLRGEVPLIGYRSHRLIFQDGLMYYSISETKIAAVNSLGMAEKIYDLGNYKLHHDYLFDSEGNLLVLATDTESNTVEDQVIRVDTDTGEITGVLDLRTLFADYMNQELDMDSEELDWLHINAIQYLGDETLILSSRETSTILKITGAFTDPSIEYMIGYRKFWDGTGYEKLLLEKDESNGSFPDTGGQHSVTYVEDDSLPDGQYYLYMFNNNFGLSESREFSWDEIEGMETSMTDGQNSYFYKYLVDENKGTYQLVQSFKVPFSAYVSSVQEYNGNIVVDSGMAGLFGEYDSEGRLIREFEMKLAKNYIYRVYKYDFSEFMTIIE